MAEPDVVDAGLVGRTLGEFTIRRLLGRGGMGDVYEADQTVLQRRVAVKVLREDLVKDPTYLQRFQAEARTIARIQHPNIVSVITIGEAAGVHYMAMEFVDGRNLRDHIARQGALEEKEVVAIFKKTAAALQRAHEEGVVHRDVKPENILITRKTPHRPSEVKVADFGLARRMAGEVGVTQPGMTMGTPLYMSPEQIRGEAADPRSDVYSLGVTAYHMLAGEPPYMGDTPMAVAVKHLQGNATPLHEIRPDASPDLCRLIERMMAVRVEERTASAAEVLKELNKVRPGPGLGAPTRPTPEVFATGPTEPTVKPAAPPTLAQTISNHMLRARDAVGDERRLHWIAPLSLAGAVVLGAISAWALRERDPFALAAAEVAAVSHHERLLKTAAAADDEAPADPMAAFEDAIASSPDQREAALWRVLQSNQSPEPEAVRATLNAAVELYRLYRDRDEEALIEEVVQWLADRQAIEQHTLGYLLRGMVRVRRGEYEKARGSFENAFKGGTHIDPEEFDRQRVQALAEEFSACVHRMTDNATERKKLSEEFWRRYTPDPNRGPKKG